MIRGRNILLFILVMLCANCITALACNDVCNYIPIADSCYGGGCGILADDDDSTNIDEMFAYAQNDAELIDCGQPMRVCSSRPVRLLSSRVGGSRTLLGVSGCEPNGRILKCNFGGERCHSASKPFPMRFYASEKVVALRRILC